ncbi:G2/mitotic-specific cyclin S13-7-like protein [Tanacetum coccineum]
MAVMVMVVSWWREYGGGSGEVVAVMGMVNQGEAALKNLTLDSVKRISIKPPKSIIIVLIARSKVTCGINARPKDPVVNIDASDINNELVETEYVEDIYKLYKLSETEGGLRDYMDS